MRLSWLCPMRAMRQTWRRHSAAWTHSRCDAAAYCLPSTCMYVCTNVLLLLVALSRYYLSHACAAMQPLHLATVNCEQSCCSCNTISSPQAQFEELQESLQDSSTDGACGAAILFLLTHLPAPDVHGIVLAMQQARRPVRQAYTPLLA